MVRVTDPDESRAFYEALGFRYRGDLDIVRDEPLVAPGFCDAV